MSEYMLVAFAGSAESARVALLYNLAAYGVSSFGALSGDGGGGLAGWGPSP